MTSERDCEGLGAMARAWALATGGLPSASSGTEAVGAGWAAWEPEGLALTGAEGWAGAAGALVETGRAAGWDAVGGDATANWLRRGRFHRVRARGMRSRSPASWLQGV